MAQVSIDFTGVEAGGGSPKIPEGDYGFKIVKAISKKAESGNSMIVFNLKVVEGNADGMNKVLRHQCVLTKQSLWNLRNLLEATGKTVPAKAIKIDLDKLINLTLAGSVIDDAPYKGRVKSIVSAFFPMADLNKSATDESDDATDTEGEDTESGEESDSEAEELFD